MSGPNGERFQFMHYSLLATDELREWWKEMRGNWLRFGFRPFMGGWKNVYEWTFMVGPFELRRWADAECEHKTWHDTNHAGRLCDDCGEELDVPPPTEEELARHKAEHEELLTRWRRFDAQQKAQREAIEAWNAQPLHMRLRILSTMHACVAGEHELIDAAPKPSIQEYEAASWAAVAVLRCVVKP